MALNKSPPLLPILFAHLKLKLSGKTSKNFVKLNRKLISILKVRESSAHFKPSVSRITTRAL